MSKHQRQEIEAIVTLLKALAKDIDKKDPKNVAGTLRDIEYRLDNLLNPL